MKKLPNPPDNLDLDSLWLQIDQSLSALWEMAPGHHDARLTAEQLLVLERLKEAVIMNMRGLRQQKEEALIAGLDSKKAEIFAERCGPQSDDKHMSWRAVTDWITRQLFALEQEVLLLEDFALRNARRQHLLREIAEDHELPPPPEGFPS